MMINKQELGKYLCGKIEQYASQYHTTLHNQEAEYYEGFVDGLLEARCIIHDALFAMKVEE